MPVLIFLGLPAHTAIATCRIGLVAGNATGLYRLHRDGKVSYRIGIPLVIVSAIGAFLVSRALLTFSGPIIEKLFGFFALLVVAVTLCKRDLGTVRRVQESPLLHGVGYVLLFLIGIISAFFSASTGLLGRSVLMFFFGQTFLESAGTRKLQSVAVGWTAAITFALSGVVNWSFAFALALGMAIGSYLGVVYAVKKGDAWVRTLFIAIVLLSAVELLLGTKISS